MNLSDIRDAVFQQADWAPTQSDDAVARVNTFINRAYNQLALEAPFLFVESEITFTTQEDVIGSSTDYIRVITTADTSTGTPRNAWVMKRDQYQGASGYDDWEYDRSWDGRMIDIIESDGTVHRNQIRTIWLEQNVSSTSDEFRLSLVRPWDVTEYGYGPFTYRIYSDKYFLPDDMIELKSARLRESGYNWPLTVLSQEEAEQRSLADARSQLAAGQPRAIFRRGHFQLPGPKVAPDVETGDTQVATQLWRGPEPPGKFSYRITYTWGKRDTDLRNAGVAEWSDNATPWLDDAIDDPEEVTNYALDRYREPLWESAPSPVSSEVTTSIPDDRGSAILLTLPNIEYMLGFMMKGTDNTAAFARTNYARSGWHVRIYRRRHTEDFTNYTQLSDGSATVGTGQTVDSLQKLDLSDKFYLLAEVRIDDINDGVFIDNGSIIPDYLRPLREVHGYQSLQMYPKPDGRYEVDVRCIRRPEKLVDDTDAPRVHAEAVDVLIHRALMLLYEHQGNPALAELSRTRYMDNLATLKKRYASQRPSQVPVARGMARARAGLTGRGGTHRWWSNE